MEKHTILRLGHLGDGIADGPVFAPMTLPGERVEGVRDGDRLKEVRILEPSSQRVAPPCRHFRSCGGCAVQHMAEPAVAQWKQGVVAAALRAQGLSAEIAGIHTSPPQSRRRAALSARRTKKGAIAGFHGRASGTIVEIPGCQLLHPDLMTAIPAAEALAEAGAARKGEITVTATLSNGGLDISVAHGKALDEALRLDLTRIAQERQLARLSWDGEVIVTLRPPEQSFAPARVVPPPGAFLQATADGQQVLLEEVLRQVRGAKQVADLFAGCGTFALPLSAQAAVHAVEGDRAMIQALEAGWRKTGGLHRLTSETRDLFRNPLTADDLERFDAVVIDPPRAGAEAQVAEIVEARVPRVVHVSCQPATFAREARTLIGAGYEMSPILIVDQFRWSAHVELVAGFTLNSA